MLSMSALWQTATRTGWPVVYRAPKANSGNDGQSTEATYRQTKGFNQRTASSLEMSDPDFDRQATLGGLVSALRGTNESMSHK
jgi:hypothetical protein